MKKYTSKGSILAATYRSEIPVIAPSSTVELFIADTSPYLLYSVLVGYFLNLEKYVK